MLKKRILAKGYPVNNPTYPISHMLASKEEKKKFGASGYNKLNTIAKKNPGQLLGTHHGNHIDISKIVPQALRPEVRYHEKREIEWMRKLKKH